ncbi:hypothetical protein RHGRI_016514 [Rhododendron griersonianum]|uniref:Uncharacterized protein n=1 Tax=Rhododendron griersonianum TaxID=479676 RepID=A0AAV6JUF4_9ERIC|nr:hypothetical protein RHGRI_016514 [Rhododendron griersonianum]
MHMDELKPIKCMDVIVVTVKQPAYWLVLQGTLRDLNKGGRNISLDLIEPEIPNDIKPSIMEGEDFSGNQGDPGIPADLSAAIKGRMEKPSVSPDEEDSCGNAEDTDSLPVGILDSFHSLDEQETLLEFASASETDIDIPPNFI